MYRFFQRNQKKLLAVFGAFLMVVFILPSTVGTGGGGRQNPVVAYVGKDKIFMSELGQARADWEQLKRVRPIPISQFQQIPWVRYKLGPVLAMEIDQSPELFLLLQKEAQRMGIRAAPDRVENLLHGELEGPPNASQDDKDRRRHAAEAFVTVQSLYERLADNVKVSQPMVDHHLAMQAQELKLNLVEFRAEEFKGATTAPTTQEVEQHFRRYANVPESQPTTAPASLPFGYQFPDRVKLQYLTLKKEQVREAVKKTKSDYDWEVAARRHYLANQRDYPATQPNASPLGPALPGGAAAPSTQPFAEVRTQVLEKVMQPEVDRMTAEIRAAIAKRLSTAWEQHRSQGGGATRPTGTAASRPASSPATSPASTQPGEFASFAFLERLAADVQKQFGVLPSVTSKADQWLTADDLAKLPGIGVARTTRDDGQTFANYVVQSAEPFFPVPKKADPAQVLSLLEPSEPLEDFDGNVYFFRLTGAEAAHAPSDVNEVRDRVVADVLTGRAYARTIEEAKKLLDAAKKESLEKAAAAAGRVVKTTGSFSRGRFGLPTTIPNYPLDPEGRGAFVQQAYQLLTEATPDRPNPVMVIELPSERRVLVAELAGVTSQLRDNQAFIDRLMVARQMSFRQASELAADYFRTEAVKSRLGYRSTDPEEEKRQQEERRKESAEQAAAN